MLKLVQTDWGRFDLAIDDPAADDAAAAAATVIYAALATDAQAPAGRVDDDFDRRGWWEDPSAGTGLWYIRRQTLDSAARAEAIAMIEARLSAVPALSEVAVTETKARDAAGNVSSVILEIAGLHNGRRFLIKAPL